VAVGTPVTALPWRMADSSEAEAELRLARVKALSERDLVAVVTYILARHPDTFPDMLDEALSAVSPKADRENAT
jgi:hypothetical protein